VLTVPGSKHDLCPALFRKTLNSPSGAQLMLSAHPAVNGYLALYRPVEGESGEEEEWHPTLFIPLPVQLGFSLTLTTVTWYVMASIFCYPCAAGTETLVSQLSANQSR